MRTRLGEFDPPELSPTAEMTGDEEPWYSQKHKALVRKVTEESIVLLKNRESFCHSIRARCTRSP